MHQRLEELARQLEQEILATGTITLKGIPMVKTTICNESPSAGLCGYAVEKLRELAPDLSITRVAVLVSGGGDWIKCSRHVFAEVRMPEGIYLIDPTIKQYLPAAPTIYGPGERYPLKLVWGSLQRWAD